MLLSLILSLSSAIAATYQVDASHSRVGFAVSHMMVSTVRGEFGTVSGTVDYDPANVSATKVSAEVSVVSVATREAKRDEHLESAEFLDAAKFPSMTFVSKSVKNPSSTGFDLVGDLTIRGVKKEVTFRVNPISKEYKDPWGNVKAGTSATATINRQDFGVSWNATLDGGGYVVGDDVKIELDIELLKE